MSLIVNIDKRFGVFALRAAFEADNGVLGLLGASGCGKSVTLRCIAGVEKPDSGSIVLNGVTLFDSERKINLPPQQRRVGYLFQNYALFPNMSVRKNILCGLGHMRDKAQRERAYQEVIQMMQLEDLQRHYPAQLSGGQQQRTALARILIGRPNILMLDEPFSALDAHLRDQLVVQTKALLEQYGGISMLVTHSRDEAYQMCDRIALMESGRFLTVKPTKQLFANPESISGAVMTGCKNISRARKIDEYTAHAEEWGIRLTTAQPIRDDLCAVGIRGHYFGLESEQNRFAVRVTNAIEEPFEWNIQFRYMNQDDASKDLWWRIPKDRKPQEAIAALGVSAANILPLYPEQIRG